MCKKKKKEGGGAERAMPYVAASWIWGCMSSVLIK